MSTLLKPVRIAGSAAPSLLPADFVFLPCGSVAEGWPDSIIGTSCALPPGADFADPEELLRLLWSHTKYCVSSLNNAPKDGAAFFALEAR